MPKIMVVDDDSVFRESVKRHLGDEFTYAYAETLGEARTALAIHSPDCVLLDFRLPDGEGTTLLPELVEAEVPVVMCTARGSEALAVRSLMVGADDYLAKSELRELDLKRAVDNAMERSRLRATVREKDAEKDALIKQLQAALEDIKTLQGLIPICAGCKKIRDDDGFWQSVEEYVSQCTGASFTHGFCPECFESQMEVIKAHKKRVASGDQESVGD